MRRAALATAWILIVVAGSCTAVILPSNRRAFLSETGSTLIASTLSGGSPDNPFELDANQVSWDNTESTANFGNLRYDTSTLLNGSSRRRVPAPSKSTCFPYWMEGVWKMSYKFKKASFPQGRDKLTLRVPGAGLGTCLALPNVGYNPASFVARYQKFPMSNDKCSYEDLAYNIPRRWEAFWPESKVTAVQTGVSETLLTPKCFVTGEGCSLTENPSLHSPSSRVAMEFMGPTRSGGFVSQEVDVTMVGGKECLLSDTEFIAYRQYTQFNVQQDLQSYYKEIMHLFLDEQAQKIKGYIRVAAFLPKTEATQQNYNELDALAIYDYKIQMELIDENEATQM